MISLLGLENNSRFTRALSEITMDTPVQNYTNQ